MEEIGLIDPDLALKLLEAPDAESFSAKLLSMAQSMSGVDEIFAYVTGPEAGPRVLVSSSLLEDAPSRARAYTARFHRSDPVGALYLSTRPGSGFARRIPTSSIERGEYRRLCFEAPRFAEKICFGWRRPDQSIVLSFYRREGEAEPDMALLASLAQLAITGLTKLAKSPADLIFRLNERLAEVFPSLTPRERDVSARSLAGQTAREIGQDLGLSSATVLTYRQRAYQKTGCSKANDLLGLVM